MFLYNLCKISLLSNYKKQNLQYFFLKKGK